MALPKQVREQIKAAEEIEKQLTPNEETTQEEKPELSVVPDEQPEEPETEKVAEETEEPEEAELVEEKSEEAPAEPQQPEETEEVDYKARYEEAKHKYDVLNGKYTKEVPRLARQIRDQNQEISRLQTITTSVSEAPDAKDEAVTLLTDEERQEYDPEFLDVVGRAATEKLSPEVATLKKQIDTLQEQLGQVHGELATQTQSKVDDRLTQLVPNWQELNTDQNFILWLNKLDTRAGATYSELLNKAYQRSDAETAASFFSEFLTENGRGAELQQPELGQEDRQEKPVRRPTIPAEELAVPGQPAGTRPSSAPKGKRIWKTSEIAKFYSDCQRGKYRTKQSEKTKIERSIVTAGREGRVVRG